MRIWLKRLLKLSLFFTLLIPFLFFIDRKKTIHDISKMNRVEIYDRNNELIYTSFNLHEGNYVSLDEISDITKKIFINEEDKRFYKHNGFDIYRIFKSFFSGSSSGASTITQQYIKNLYLNNKRSYKRKLKELYLSIRLELDYSKNEIFEGYLNTIYFGHNLYGIHDASMYYFGHNPMNLSISEACVLRNIIKNPTKYSPILNYENAYIARNALIKELSLKGLITENEAKNALCDQLIIKKMKPKLYQDSFLYFKDLVLEELKKYSISNDYNQTIKIYTNYDSLMNKAVMEVINENDEDCAFIAVDKDGYYLSAIGGNNYIESSFNIALNGKRAIASTAKPLLYYDAILHGYGNIKLMSSPTSFKINNKTYTFKNFGSIYENRLITMEEALAVSDNMYALRMQVLLGLNGVSRTLKAFGIEDKESLNQALGTTEMSLKQLLSFYYAFNYDGLKTSFKAIKKIVINNQTKYINHPEYKQVLNKKACNILKSKLSAMFNTYNLIQKPTGTRIKDKLKIKIKGKSGLDDYNSYMIGFSDDYVLGAWTGFKEMKLLTNVNAKIAPKLMVLNAINSLY